MRLRLSTRWIVVSLFVVLGVWFVAQQHRSPGEPLVTLSVKGYSITNGSTIISVVVTNRSVLPIVYQGRPPFSNVECLTDDTWREAALAYISKSSSGGYVLPGESFSYRLSMAEVPARFRVSTFFETGGFRIRLFSWFHRTGLRQRFTATCDSIVGFLPKGKPQYIHPCSSEIVLNAVN